MKSKLDVIYFVVILLSGCSTYSEEDYGEPDTLKSESLCVNMEPAQEARCKEREKKLIISLGADKNCNHPYEYEKNRCKNEKVKQKKLLDESLKKHKK
jgi:hypothetical protein